MIQKPSDIQVSIALDTTFEETPGGLYTFEYLFFRVVKRLEVLPDQIVRVSDLTKKFLEQYTGEKDQGYSFGMTQVIPDPDYPEYVETRYFAWRHKK